jgi:hypothetical protein
MYISMSVYLPNQIKKKLTQVVVYIYIYVTVQVIHSRSK